MILRSPPAADCSGGKADDARTTRSRTGKRVEGRSALAKRLLNTPQNSPQLEGIGDSDGMVVEGDSKVSRIDGLPCKKDSYLPVSMD